VTRTVRVPHELEAVFRAAEDVVSRFFASRSDDPEHGTIEIFGERYILVRAASLSVEFFAVVEQLFGPGHAGEADEFARNILFDLAHALGRSDARNFHAKMGLTDPIARLSAGPVHFSHTGWAFVDILPESNPEPGAGYYLIYDHPYAFESEAWLRAEKTSEFPVCVMNAGYSSGWCEESFGLHLIASEVLCRAKGDEVCRFIMAPPETLEQRVRAYLDAQTSRSEADRFEIPDFFSRKRADAELRRLYDRLQELDASKTRFFANVSHELRTPLAVISGVAERLKEELDGAAQREGLETIVRSARMLLGHVESLLEIAKLESGRMELRYEEVDLAALVRLIASYFEVVAADRGIRFVVNVPSTLPAELDAEKLQQVLSNLLANAFKFVPDGGIVRCTLERPSSPSERSALLEVADSGPGIPAEARERVFERFVELDDSHRFGGVGLGLAIVRELTTLHGGSVAVATAPEGGALLRVELPICSPVGARVRRGDPSVVVDPSLAVESLRAPKVPETVPRGPEAAPLVLVVEDHVEMSNFLAKRLSGEYRVATAFDGREGFEKVCELRPDLVLTDVMMPGLTGDELVRQMRSRSDLDAIPIIVLTAKADDALRIRVLSEGAQDCLTKPILTEELMARTRNLVGLKRARDILQEELRTHQTDIERLARDVARTKRELRDALDRAVVARDHAESAAKGKAMFLSLVSHELRTPLQTMSLNLEAFEGRGGWSTPEAERLMRLRRASNRLLELVESLLELSRDEAGRLETRRQRVSLGDVVREVVEDLQDQADQEGLELRVRVPSDLPATMSDERLIRLTLVNLLSNAIKYTERGWVEVAVDVDDEGYRLSVTDTGPGIPPDQQVLIFEPFRRLEPHAKKDPAGVGIGLTLVRAMVRAIGGRVTVSSAIGRGTCFTVYLPRGS
jgi:signal transduction histidine kinase